MSDLLTLMSQLISVLLFATLLSDATPTSERSRPTIALQPQVQQVQGIHPWHICW